MKYLKRFFSVVAMALCFALCMDAVSHAATIKYKETKLSIPIKGFSNVEDVKLRVNSSGKIQLNLYYYLAEDMGFYEDKNACVTYSSNGKKQVNVAGVAGYYSYCAEFYDGSGYKDPYGNFGYKVHDNILYVYKKTGEKVKTVKIDDSKYKKNKRDYINFKIAEITAKNIVRLFYYSNDWTDDFYRGYGGMLEVNTTTKKVKKLVATNFVPVSYDGKYLYGKEYYNNRSHGNIISDKTIYYQKSIKTKKIKKITTDSILYDEKKYEYSPIEYSFYKGKVMVVCPTGEVYYAAFGDKKFMKIGDISRCKNFRKFTICGFAMKSKNEFYILYMPERKNKQPEDTCQNSYGKVFLAKYKK